MVVELHGGGVAWWWSCVVVELCGSGDVFWFSYCGFIKGMDLTNSSQRPLVFDPCSRLP